MDAVDLKCGVIAWVLCALAMLVAATLAAALAGWITQRVGGTLAVSMYARTYGARFRLPLWAAIAAVPIAVSLAIPVVQGILYVVPLPRCAGVLACLGWPAATTTWILVLVIVAVAASRAADWRATRRRMAATLAHPHDPMRRGERAAASAK